MERERERTNERERREREKEREREREREKLASLSEGSVGGFLSGNFPVLFARGLRGDAMWRDVIVIL